MQRELLIAALVLAIGIVGIIVDRSGMFGAPTIDITPARILAVVLVAAGAYLFVRA